MKKIMITCTILLLTANLASAKKFSPFSKERIAQRVRKTVTKSLHDVLKEKKTIEKNDADTLAYLIEKAQQKTKKIQQKPEEEIIEIKEFIAKLVQTKTKAELEKQKETINKHISDLTKRLLQEASTNTKSISEIKTVLSELITLRDALS